MATSRQLREQIAAGRWDAALAALYGGSEEVLARQRSRYGAALEQFELYYGPGRQVQVYSAPGRTELGGTTPTTSTVTALRVRSRWTLWRWHPGTRMASSGSSPVASTSWTSLI